MHSPENPGPPHLEVVRNYEDLPEDMKVIEAYCDELLQDKNGLRRSFAFHSWTPFAHTTREWSRAILRRGADSYTISCYGEISDADPLFENTLDHPLYEIDMRPYRTVYPGLKPPKGAEWYIQAGRAELGAPTETSNDPAYFRIWLEELWGPLPKSVQAELGITQTTPTIG